MLQINKKRYLNKNHNIQQRNKKTYMHQVIKCFFTFMNKTKIKINNEDQFLMSSTSICQVDKNISIFFFLQLSFYVNLQKLFTWIILYIFLQYFSYLFHIKYFNFTYISINSTKTFQEQFMKSVKHRNDFTFIYTCTF